MNSKYRAFGMVMAANVEALVIFYLAHETSQWLDMEYPIESGWQQIIYVVGIVVVGVLWFRMFSSLVRQTIGKKDASDDS